jgi:hypothetical protein
MANGPRPLRARIQSLAALLVTLCVTLTIVSAADASQPVAVTSALHSAVTARAAATHTLASRTRALESCLRLHPKECEQARLAARRASSKLAHTDRLIAELSASAKHFRHRQIHVSPTPPTNGGSHSGTSTGGTTSGTGTGTTGTGTTSSGSTSTGTGTSSTGSGSGSGTKTEGSTVGTGNTGSETSGAGTGTGNTGSGTQTEAAAPSGPFEMGVVAGSALLYELPFIEKLGAHTARTEFEIGTPASQMDSIMEAYARAGVKPLLLASFDGTIPTPEQAKDLGTWAAQFGPGGSFWAGKNLPAGSAVTSIEFGNETSYSYQYSNDSDSASGYATRAQEYATRFKEAAESIHAANPNVGLLAQGDPGNAPGTSWMDNMFKAVPNLGSLVAGWTVHPYGPNWQSIMDEVLSSAQADGAPASIPMYVTEWGLATDNGRCLSNNYGFNECMTYQEAATTLQSTVAAMRARYGSRLAGLYVYEAHDLKATGASTEREAYFGALQSNEAPKGAYTTTVQSLLSTNP